MRFFVKLFEGVEICPAHPIMINGINPLKYKKFSLI